MNEAVCYFCKEPVDPEDTYCFGCKEHICEECDETTPWGSHEPEDHKDEESQG